MRFERDFAGLLTRSAGLFPVVVLTGARQTGKTTLLRTTFPSLNYVSLDLPSLAESAERDPGAFFRRWHPPVIVDEVQYSPGLFRHVKRLVDEKREIPGQFFLTGSQKFSLMKTVSDSLAGRCMWLELETLSFEEIARGVPPSQDLLVQTICRGQFPELWRVPDIPAQDFYHSYLATYLERDVRQLLNVGNLRDFDRFLRLLATRSGQLLNRSDLARDTGISVNTASAWISVLEASNQIFLLEPWHMNFSKRIVKSPKVYFADSGLLCHLLGLDQTSLPHSAMAGSVWETFAFSQLRKLNHLLEPQCRIWFYRDQRAREIDFVLERGGRLSFLECKWTETPTAADLTSTANVSRELQESSIPFKPGNKGVLCRAANGYPLTDNARAVPVAELREWLDLLP